MSTGLPPRPLPSCHDKYYPTVAFVLVGVFVAIIIFLIIALVLMWQSVWDNFPGTSQERVGLILLVTTGLLAIIGIVLAVVVNKSKGDTGLEVECATPARVWTAPAGGPPSSPPPPAAAASP